MITKNSWQQLGFFSTFTVRQNLLQRPPIHPLTRLLKHKWLLLCMQGATGFSVLPNKKRFNTKSQVSIRYLDCPRRMWVQMCINSPKQCEHHILIPTKYARFPYMGNREHANETRNERMRRFTTNWNLLFLLNLLWKPFWNTVKKQYEVYEASKSKTKL